MKSKKSHLYSLQRKEGAIIIVALFFATAVGLMVGSYLRLASNELKLSTRAFLSNAAFNLAEAAAEEAIWSFTKEDWSSWDEYGTYATKEVTNFQIGSDKEGSFRVVVENYNSGSLLPPTILAEGKVRSATGMESVRQLEISLGNRSLFANAMTSKSEVTISGGAAAIDSYDSAVGQWDPNTNRKDKGTVGTLSMEFGDLDAGNSDIYGYVATGGGIPVFGPNAKVYGEGWNPGDPLVDPDRIALDFTADFPDVDPPTLSASAKDDSDPDITYLTSSGSPGERTISGGLPTSPVEYHLTALEMNNNRRLIIDSNSYVVMRVDGDVDISKLTVRTGANLTLYVNGDFTVSGNGYANDNTKAETFVVYGTNNDPANPSTFTLNGSASLCAAVYAPNAALTMNGGGSGPGFMGAAVGKSIALNGGVTFHYDEGLAGFGSNGAFQMKQWKELISQLDRFDFNDYSPQS